MTTGDAELRVSVVMATYNRSSLLPTALDALLEQPGLDEIVVVDDSSTDTTASALEDYRSRHPDRLRVLRTERNSGPAVARNRGWRAASGDWIAFTDDDCVVTDGWIGALRALVASADVDVVQGRTEPDPSHSIDHAWRRRIECYSFSHRFETCNLFASRRALEAVDGFDESFPFAGEDADCGWRMLESGFTAAFAEDAIVYHAVRPLTLREQIRARWAWGQLLRFYARHPGARAVLLYRGLFHRRSHVTVMVLALALLVVARRSVPAALGLYLANVARTTRKNRGDGRSLANGIRFNLADPVVTFSELIAFILGSIRHRTLVL